MKKVGELQRNLAIVGSIAALALIILTGAGLYRFNSHNVLLHAEEDAVRISAALTELEKATLFSVSPSGKYVPFILPEKIPDLDNRLRTFLKTFDIVKIKIYSKDMQIIYSTEAGIIGKIDGDNHRLERALAGSVDSHLETKSSFRDLADEQHIAINVVETYVPIRDPQGGVIGCLELYVNVTKYKNRIMTNVLYSIAILTGALLLVFFFAQALLRKALHQLEEAQKRLHELATTDPLTGLFNRRHVLERAKAELVRIFRTARSTESTKTLGFIMLDLDNFKHINDTYGHPVGDTVLAHVTKLIKGACREYDIVGRYGGEEFLVALPDVERSEINRIAERIRESVARNSIMPDSEISLAMTISGGTAYCLQGENDIYPAIKRADDALYLAKRNGRDQIKSSQPA